MLVNYQGKSFFDSLVSWDEVEQLLLLVPEEDHHEALETMMAVLDHAVLERTLHHLHLDHHHDFLALCHEGYHEPKLLIWLEERSQGITEIIRVTIAETHQEIRVELSQP